MGRVVVGVLTHVEPCRSDASLHGLNGAQNRTDLIIPGLTVQVYPICPISGVRERPKSGLRHG
jgi:hypothetical protein